MRRAYRRPMAGWWRRDRWFVRYMVREATALGVAAYALVLLSGVVCLALGPVRFQAWQQAMSSAPAIVLHGVLLAAMVYHAVSWFEIMPKTMPAIFIGAERLAARTITRAGYAAAAIAALALFAAAWMLAR